MSSIVGIVWYHEGSQKHLNDLDPISDFLVPHCLGIGSSVSGIRSGHIRENMYKI